MQLLQKGIFSLFAHFRTGVHKSPDQSNRIPVDRKREKSIFLDPFCELPGRLIGRMGQNPIACTHPICAKHSALFPLCKTCQRRANNDGAQT